jgi:hypothetical protein
MHGIHEQEDFQAMLRAAGETENPQKKISEIGLSWMKETLNFCFLSLCISLNKGSTLVFYFNQHYIYY